jgi:mRNA-degrading endonuclease RelE of RelBE toxin-antitoxin system
MYKLKTTPKFEKSVKKLPQKQKNKLSKTLLQLQNDPKHNSLYTKKNRSASNVTNELIYESRIDNKYRVIWKYENNQVILLLLTGNHNIVEGKK